MADFWPYFPYQPPIYVIARADSGTELAPRRRVNFVAGSGVTLTLEDNTAQNEAKLTVSASGSGVSDGDKGDITVSSSGTVWTIDNDAVTDAKLRNSGALSVIGRAANSTGDPADIAVVAASGAVLRESGSTLGFGTVATAGIADNAATDGKLRDSAALSVIGRSANSTGDPADIAAGTDKQVLRRSGTSLSFGAVDLTSSDAVTGALTVPNGGTGQTTLGNKAVLIGNIAGAVTWTSPTAAGALLIDQGSGNTPVFTVVTGDVTINGSGVTVIGAGKVTEAMQVLADNTTNNSSTTKHGYLKKLPNDASQFMNGVGDWADPSSGASVGDVVVLQEQQTQNTSGGSFNSGAWRTRVLNTEVVDTGGVCSLASNQFTLTAGTYEILTWAPAFSVNDHQIKLYNATDAADILFGGPVRADSTVSNGMANNSMLMGRFTVGASKALEIRHQCLTTKATNGFGLAGNFATEIYTTVWLRKVA